MGGLSSSETCVLLWRDGELCWGEIGLKGDKYFFDTEEERGIGAV